MKIVIISQHLFPIQTPRAYRTTELAKEFGKRGYEVIIYAVLGKYNYSDFEKKSDVKVKNIPIKWQIKPYSSDGNKIHFIDKVIGRLFNKLFEFPNIEFMFCVPKILKKEKDVDLLISIAVPHQIHWGCAKSKIKNPNSFPKKWIADCGDPFMKNGLVKEHYKYFEKYERIFCEQCDYITVPIEEAKGAYYEEYRNKIKVIPQGFDFDLSVQEINVNNDIINFLYAGTFFKDNRHPEIFLKFIDSLNIDFRFHVFTKFEEIIRQYKPLLKEKLIIHNPIDRKNLVEFMKKMDFLLNLENVNRPGQLPSKLIDYAIAKRPILSINPVEINKNLIMEFFEGNYKNQLKISNIEQYYIKNVADKFLSLLI